MSPSIADIIARMQRDKVALGITLYPPATAAELADFEQKIGVRLPSDLRMFYSFCNGFESAEDLFRIIPLGEIIENEFGRAYSFKATEGWDFYLAEYVIYSDCWAIWINKVHPDQYAIGSYNSEEYNTLCYGIATPANNIVMTNSLAVFLDKFLRDGVHAGIIRWREELAKQQ
ncbi:MAG: SMI1/KNR4 family protein [Janthinobacterium lividum]